MINPEMSKAILSLNADGVGLKKKNEISPKKKIFLEVNMSLE